MLGNASDKFIATAKIALAIAFATCYISTTNGENKMRKALTAFALAAVAGCNGYTEAEQQHAASFKRGDVAYLPSDPTRKVTVGENASPTGAEVTVHYFDERGRLQQANVSRLLLKHEAK